MSPRRAVVALSLACCLVTLAPPGAHAYEDQATLGVDLGWSGAPSAQAGVPRHGATLGVSGTWGLGDTWALGARLAYALHPADAPLHVGVAGVEVLYLVDVLSVVPSLGVGIDGFFGIRDGRLGADLAVHALLSFDYLMSRRWLLGVDVRAFALPFAFDDGGLSPFAMQASVRLSATFDRF